MFANESLYIRYRFSIPRFHQVAKPGEVTIVVVKPDFGRTAGLKTGYLASLKRLPAIEFGSIPGAQGGLAPFTAQT